MRCYFMRNGRIENVHFLSAGTDQYLIQQATALFEEHFSYDGFEVWDGKRFVYLFDKRTGTVRAPNVKGQDDA
jgi:hypothetical protein